MFFNPAKTGLIVLGASEFSHAPELNRRVFRNAHDEIVSYFRSPSKGLGLHRKNIFYGFDKNIPKGELLLQIDQFLSERELSDVFVYICSHGKVPEKTLRFFIASSVLDDQDTWVNFETLFDRVEQTALCRTYYLVDCCASGAIHKHSPDIAIPPEVASYISNAETLALPRRGSVILSANNATNIGTVYAHDSLPGIDLPLFSHCLIDLLNTGSYIKTGFGLSVEQIHDDMLQRLPEAIDKTNKVLADQGLETLSDEHGTMVPQYTDRPIFDAVNGNIISRIGVFPNNNSRHELPSRVARSIRINYDRVSRQWDRIQELEELVQPLQAQIETLKSESRRMIIEEIEPRKLQIENLKETITRMEGDIKLFKLSRRGAHRFAAVVVLALVAALAALIFDFDPFLDLRSGQSE